MKKKTIAVAIAMALTMVAQAQDYDYPYLAFQTADGAVKAVAVEALTLTFVNGQLVATNGDGNYSFALNDLSKMCCCSSCPHPKPDRISPRQPSS